MWFRCSGGRSITADALILSEVEWSARHGTLGQARLLAHGMRLAIPYARGRLAEGAELSNWLKHDLVAPILYEIRIGLSGAQI